MTQSIIIDKKKIKGPFSLALSFAMSTGLHIFLFLGIAMALGISIFGVSNLVRQQETLNLELLGMLSDQQEIGQEVNEPEPEPEPIAEPEPIIAPPALEPEPILENEVYTPAPEYVPPPPPKPLPKPKPKPKSASDKPKVAKRLDAPTNTDLTRKYLAELSRRLTRNLVYPEEAKMKGMVGQPILAFTITEAGALLGDKVSVVRSSGHEILDRYAIMAIKKTAPFAKPHKLLEMTITLNFKRDM
ncbi:MAG: energy transducer TonB [Deltaproteobacteria bacterium]|jgi:protein TonB|nr:energy transducer TonB [Deltaproteobacteria bacterium]